MQKQAATLLLIITLGLIALGLVMLSSTSSMLAPVDMQAVYGNLRKQCLWLVVGGVLCILLARCEYQKLLRYAPWGLGLAVVLLVFCFVPHLRVIINGSPRWIQVAGWRYQPSEFAKVALIVFLAWWLGKNRRQMHEFLPGFLYPTLFAVPVLTLIALEKDFGTAALLLFVAMIMLFCAGTRWHHLALLPGVGLTGLVLAVILNPNRVKRIMDWMNLGDYQQSQALIALGSGGPWGLGLGNSRQKWGFLPEVNTDFVFAVVGEELGMWFALGVVLAFILLTLGGGWIAIHAPDNTGVFLGIGFTCLIMLQTIMNMAVVTSLVPCKGIPLPFISYGGSSLLTCMMGIGFLFNIQRQGVYKNKPVTPQLLAHSYSVRM